jgi:invasion protein IalB
MTEVTERFRGSTRSMGGGMAGRIAVRAIIGILLLAAGGVLAIAGERLLGGGSSPNEIRIATFQDWQVICPTLTPATPNCALRTEVNRDTGGVILTLAMTDPAPGSTLSLTVPNGVMLEPGMGFSIGTEPTRVRPFETCTAQGCIAMVTLDADTLKSLQSNMGGQVAVAPPPPPNGVAAQPITIPYSLKGFPEGYAELQRAKARRTGLFSFLTRS